MTAEEALKTMEAQAWIGRIGEERLWWCRWCNVYKPGPHDAKCPVSIVRTALDAARTPNHNQGT